MAFGRGVRSVVVAALLAVICTSFVGDRCDLPRADQSEAALSAFTAAAADGDPCASGCKPDCFVCSCARSEAAAYAQFGYRPPVAAANAPGPEARPIDGVLALPYHPPHRLL